jgi:hypothetical protein
MPNQFEYDEESRNGVSHSDDIIFEGEIERPVTDVGETN